MNETLSYLEHLKGDAKNLLRCPQCFSDGLFIAEENILSCGSCHAEYFVDIKANACLLVSSNLESDIKKNIRSFWGDLCKQLYQDNDATITSKDLEKQIDEVEDLFIKREHLAAVEMPLPDLAGKKVLEIGSGSGGHSCLFRKHCADVVAVDLTPERVLSTAKKLRLLTRGRGIVYQADAENLPFKENSFDIVYSNGVIHHSENTEGCVDEIYRVLKPGGMAVIMLYARHSAVYWLNIFPRGLLSLRFFFQNEARWVGHLTEGKPKFYGERNPLTRVYSAKGIRNLFRHFDELSMRRNSFQFDNLAIPKLSQIRDRILKLMNFPFHSGGILIYGKPYVCETPLELYLGRSIGWCWNIIARKTRVKRRQNGDKIS